ncbi:hypothetical protein Pfo_009635 [Paulownia fortunei]|nr:hypothetical protein Pfo_009635 [Paulownia fortunei]
MIQGAAKQRPKREQTRVLFRFKDIPSHGLFQFFLDFYGGIHMLITYKFRYSDSSCKKPIFLVGLLFFNFLGPLPTIQCLCLFVFPPEWPMLTRQMFLRNVLSFILLLQEWLVIYQWSLYFQPYL